MRIEEEHAGMRLEDMLLITANGYENLSAFVPIEIRRYRKADGGAPRTERRPRHSAGGPLMRFDRMITAVDAHACGEPGRVITGGVLDVPGSTMFEKKTWLETHADHIRLRMLREPRGYPALCCNLILPPTHPEADAGFVIMEQVEYPPMSGTNTICVVTVLIETGMVPAVEPVTHLKLETPAGLVASGCRSDRRQGHAR